MVITALQIKESKMIWEGGKEISSSDKLCKKIWNAMEVVFQSSCTLENKPHILYCHAELKIIILFKYVWILKYVLCMKCYLWN